MSQMYSQVMPMPFGQPGKQKSPFAMLPPPPQSGFDSMYKPTPGVPGQYETMFGGPDPTTGRTPRATVSGAEVAKMKAAMTPGGGFLQQLGGALSQDVASQQAAANQQWQAGQANIDAFGKALPGDVQALKDQATALGSSFESQAKGFETAAKGAAGDNAWADSVYGDVKGAVGQSQQQAQESVDSYKQAMGKYQDTSLAQASDAAGGIRAQADEARKQIASGINPDGTLMTPEQKQQAMFQLNDNVNRQVATAVTGIQARSNEFFAGMGQTLASLQQGQAQTTLAGAGTLGQAGVGLGGLREQAQQRALQYRQLAGQSRQIGAQLAQAGLLSSVQFEMQGRQAMADMIKGNPHGVISLYAGLASMFGAATAPGAQNVPAFNFG